MDVAAVARHLERTHYGLKDVKDRILEYLAVCSLLKGDQPGTILCLAGPPGTGKSSVARAVAEALGRPFARIALGGMRDEAEIRGHRRTYVGAMPGRVVEAIAKAGVDNPVLLLDELDKLASDWRGDPAAALMEVLDPAQNHAFRDNYLEVDYDLSKVLFVATANDTDAIPETLFDRLEVIRLSGYTLAEKLAIARRHLVPRVARESGLRRGDVRFGRGALQAIVRGHTREAGVRELERCLRRVFRKVARRHVEDGLALPVTVAPDDLRGYLGEAIWLETELRRTGSVGESLALAYTGDGGEVLSVEATLVRGRGDLVLTGQLGDVMQESASAAWGYLLASAERDERLRRAPARRAVVRAQGTRCDPARRARARARGRGAQGRPVGGPSHRRGDALGPHRPSAAPARRSDRRDHAERTRPARRRPQGEAAGRDAQRRPHRRPARGEPRLGRRDPRRDRRPPRHPLRARVRRGGAAGRRWTASVRRRAPESDDALAPGDRLALGPASPRVDSPAHVGTSSARSVT